ncbi:MAG: phosphatidylinositol mannoside acyltransferase [Acidimicrobiia bacterium]|nr:phosphatidylinositol mannoside acyltransferase [Acidimicrobiia bacterium]
MAIPSPSYLAYRVGAAVANALPSAVATPIAETTGRALALTPISGSRRRIVRRNLQRATDGALDGMALERAVSDTFASYGRYWLELFRLPNDARGSVEERVTSVGFHHITDALERGNGVILALPHVGGFDFAAAWLAGRGLAPTVVVEAVEPPELFEWFAEVRRAIGMEVIPLGPSAAADVVQALRSNRVVCLLADRDLAGDGVPVEFFGEETTLPAGPATLAVRSGAALIPAAVYFRPHGHHFVKIEAPLPAERQGRLREDVTRITQHLARRFEELVRMAPEQWHVMQPNWPSDHPEGANNSAAV